jgi:hypothetical protein
VLCGFGFGLTACFYKGNQGQVNINHITNSQFEPELTNGFQKMKPLDKNLKYLNPIIFSFLSIFDFSLVTCSTLTYSMFHIELKTLDYLI